MSIIGSIGGAPAAASSLRYANVAGPPKTECRAVTTWVTCAETLSVDHSPEKSAVVVGRNGIEVLRSWI